MADNTQLSAGTGGDLLSTDDVGGGVKVQRVKAQFGVDGTSTDVSATDPLPVTTTQQLDYDTGAGTQTTPLVGLALPASGGPVAGGTSTNPVQVGDAGGSLTVDGTVAATQSGTWNVGTVTTVTTVSAVTAISNALPAGANLIGRTSSSPETSTVYNGTTALTPKFAIIQESSSGTNAVVAAVTSKKIRVLAYNMIAAGSVNAKFQSDGAGTPTDLTGLKYMVVNSGICAPFNPAGWFETASGLSLDLNLSAAIAVGGELVYVEV
jgi:hypothetical protein